MTKRTLLATAALALAAACAGSDEFANATPDVRGQLVELAGTNTEGIPTALAMEGVTQQGSTSGPEYLARTRATIKALNDLVAKFLKPVEDAVAQGAKDGQPVGDAKVYGPKDENGITWLLTVRRLAPRSFAWVLQGKPAGSADSAYVRVAAGALRRIGNQAHRGSGVTGIDLDAYAGIDSSSHAQGKLLNAFKHVGDDGEAKVIVYRLKGFTADSTQSPPADAILYGHRTPSGEGVVRVVAVSESLGPLPPSTSDAGVELLLARLHWIPGTGGRADLYFPTLNAQGQSPNGDVPAGKFIVARSCWDAGEQEGFKTVLLCTAGQPIDATNCQVSVTGSAAACRPGVDTDDEPTDADKDSTATEPGAPATLDDQPPAQMPTAG